ncbi:N-acetylmuramoyl-L-alanine amidase [Clostridium sp. 19966]|uniref:N-acetylmuramoyl-L-alanine amidase family protein n=1 Tax=Clostridium sp. 19966 TaxID=2768166 RepID=UPI0028DFAB6A|nr:N-acetylmuramoyl-L-alanine amidase [Clostridium sp. 19966]MDT8718034.1 N-acetylmuramoyl-L-alanine amidase [Clostridium sp. 19966]
MIDPGHGGYDSGAVGFLGAKEKDITLQVALKLGKLLEAKNIKIIYTRTSDKVSWSSNEKLGLKARTEISNNANADYYVSIHCNYVDDKNVNGTETYYFNGSTHGKALADSIQKELIKSTELSDRGIKEADYYVLRHTAAPAILTELGFISNEREEKNLSDPAYQDKIASALCDGIMNDINKR